MLAEHQRKLQEEERRRREEEERKERERKEREERERKEREERERIEREERERIEQAEKEKVENEERERREREEREKQAREKKEREERERKQKEEAERKKEEKERKACEQKESLGETLGKEEERRRVEEVAGPGKGKRDSIEILDSEISDVLFQFEKIVGALEKETDSSRATPTDFLPLSQVTMQAGQSVENSQPESDQSRTECRAGQSHEVVNDLEGPMKTTSKDEVEEDVVQAKNHPEPLDTALSSKPPTEKSSSEEEQLLSSKISVKELQQQFLLSSVPARHTSISPEAEIPASFVNVRTRIAQMQTTKPPPSPPPSPVSKYESMNVIRRRPPSPTVYRRISELTHGLEDEKRQSKTYEPPPVRRRIQSPFLQPKKEKEGNLPVKSAGTKESTSVKQNHVFNHVTSQSDRVPAQAEHMNAQDDHMIPLEDHVTDKNRVTPVEGHVTPVEDHVTQVEDHVTPVEDRVTPVDHVSPVDHVTSVEDHVTPVEDHVTPVEDHVTPVEDHVTPVEDHVTSKDSVVIKEDDLTTKEYDATPDLTPKVDSVTPTGNRMVPTEGQVTSNEAIDKKTSKSESSPT